MEAADSDFVFKVILVGDMGVGKSALLKTYIDGRFSEFTTSTIGVDLQLQSLRIEDYLILFEFWDTAGQEHQRAITQQFYRSADAVLLMYDVTHPKSFASLPYWITEVRDRCKENCKMFLVGAKCDLESEQAVSLLQATRLARQYDLQLFQTSAKNEWQVKEIFLSVATQLVASAESNAGGYTAPVRRGTLIIVDKETPKKSRCC